MPSQNKKFQAFLNVYASKCLINCFWQVICSKMVTWKQRQHDDDNACAARAVASIAALWVYGLLKFFHVPIMLSHVRLIEYIRRMWNPEQQYFEVGPILLLWRWRTFIFWLGCLDVEKLYLWMDPEVGTLPHRNLLFVTIIWEPKCWGRRSW